VPDLSHTEIRANAALHFVGSIVTTKAGLRVAIATNDTRAGTLAELRLLGIADAVDAIVSANDADLAFYLDISANRLAIDGDTTTDMLAGRSAGVGLVIGVLSGLATAVHLAPLADAVVPDIHAVSVSGV
jgi:phosphoglycolate phosphatase